MGYPNDARQAGNYTAGVGNANEYVFHSGVCALPVAEDPPTDPTELAAWSPVEVLRLHAPYRTRRFVQAAGKEGNPSPIAAPGDTGAFTFLGGSVGVRTSLDSTYRSYTWMTSCEYHYVEACTSRDQEGKELGLVLGTLPYLSIIDSENESYGFSAPLLGAVAQGGRATTIGYHMGNTIVVGSQGELLTNWGYNSQSLYPATLFYSDLANGGKPVSEGG